MNPKLDVFETVNNIILEAMNKGIAPWKKPWTSYKDKNGNEYNGPVNLVSKKPYRGLNALILGCSSFSSPFFLTFKQAKEMGGSIKKDSKSTSVVFWQVGTKDELNSDGEIIQKKTFILKYYNVFNIDQTENINIPADFTISEKEFFQDEMAENLISTYLRREKIQTTNNSIGCYYVPGSDTINMVPAKYFGSSEEYYSTYFHEISHSTGSTDRLNRLNFENGIFGSKAYSEEELVAEISASYICNFLHLQTPDLITNSVAYLQGWSKKLKEDKMFFYKAAKKAEAAFNFITEKTTYLDE